MSGLWSPSATIGFAAAGAAASRVRSRLKMKA
jgi:hypothetical protein